MVGSSPLSSKDEGCTLALAATLNVSATMWSYTRLERVARRLLEMTCRENEDTKHVSRFENLYSLSHQKDYCRCQFTDTIIIISSSIILGRMLPVARSV